MLEVKIREDQQEVGTGKPGYRWARAWRIVRADDDSDLVQPWFSTKAQALQYIKRHNEEAGEDWELS